MASALRAAAICRSTCAVSSGPASTRPQASSTVSAGRTPFLGWGVARTSLSRPHVGVSRRGSLRVEAYIREWPEPEFIAEVKAAFPDKGVATVEEARVLFSEDGYTYLDVRPALECDEVGKVKAAVNIPLYNSSRVWSPEEKKKVIKKEKNPAFLSKVQKAFPDKQAKLLIGCSDGTAYSIEALEALDEAGYTNIVGLRGGFYSWFRIFDNKLQRRYQGEYQEDYSAEGDSCGIHGSGASFDKMDKIEAWIPPKY